MKIKTVNISEFGTEIMFGEETIKFDRLGCADIDEKLGEKLLENHIGHLVSADTVLDTDKDSIYKREVVEKTVESLKKENERLTNLVAEKEAIVKATEADNKEWKDQVEVLKEEAKKAIEELGGYKVQKEKEVSELKLKIELIQKSTAELQQYCEALKIPKEKYNTLKKDDLIQLILDESRQ